MNIPSLDLGGVQWVDGEGRLTDIAQSFMDLLLQVLTLNAGPEGLVAPSLSAANITVIQNNQDDEGNYTCQFGTIVYDTDNNQLKVALNNGGAPLFHVITVV
jgi:hypothetical protein